VRNSFRVVGGLLTILPHGRITLTTRMRSLD